MTPELEAAIEREEPFGIECHHHYGITTHDFREGLTVAETAYWLVRNAWHREALTDDNHTWEAIENVAPKWSYIRIIKNKNSPLFALRPSWINDGDGATWFTLEYRVASATQIAWEVSEKITYAERLEVRAAKERDTIRGRKARDKCIRYAAHARREAASIRSRWPQYMGYERTGWQQRLHEHRVPSSTTKDD